MAKALLLSFIAISSLQSVVADDRGSFKITQTKSMQNIDKKFMKSVMPYSEAKKNIFITLGWYEYDAKELANPWLANELTRFLTSEKFIQTKTLTDDSNLQTWQSSDRKTTVTVANPYREGIDSESELGKLFINETASVAYRALRTPHSVVLYIGHNRDQGGAFSFSPPITQSNGHVNYSAYNNFPGLQKIIQAADGHGPALIALFSCNSSRNVGIGVAPNSKDYNFAKKMKKLGKQILHLYPETFFLSTSKTMYPEEDITHAENIVLSVRDNVELSKTDLFYRMNTKEWKLYHSTEETSLWITPPKMKN